MLTKSSLSFFTFFKKNKRGAGMTEYAVLLAFIAAIASAFVFDYTQFEYNDDNTLSGTSLGTAIYSSVLNARSAITKIGAPPSTQRP